MFLVKPVFSRCFRRSSVTTSPAEMAERYTYKLLSFQIFFYFQGQIPMFRNFLCLSSGEVVGQGSSYIYYKCRFIFFTDIIILLLLLLLLSVIIIVKKCALFVFALVLLLVWFFFSTRHVLE
jgi:hypothetical protein